MGGCRGSRVTTVPGGRQQWWRAIGALTLHLLSSLHRQNLRLTSQFFSWLLPPPPSETALPPTADKPQGHLSIAPRLRLLSEATHSFSGTHPLQGLFILQRHLLTLKCWWCLGSTLSPLLFIPIIFPGCLPLPNLSAAPNPTPELQTPHIQAAYML